MEDRHRSCTGSDRGKEFARGKEFVIPVPSIGITAEERIRLKRYNRNFSKFSSLFQHVGLVDGYKRVSERYKFHLSDLKSERSVECNLGEVLFQKAGNDEPA